MTSIQDNQEAVTWWARLRSGARRRYKGSVVEDFWVRLKHLGFADLITAFGAVFFMCALPFAILVGSFASRRIDHDLSAHMGLNARASGIVAQMFGPSGARSTAAVFLAAILGFLGMIGIASSMQSTYEKIFRVSRHRKTNVLRLSLWAAGLGGWLAISSAIDAACRGLPLGILVEALAVLLTTTAFFWWSMHFLLGGAAAWGRLALPAVVTALFWLGLEGFAALYFSSTIISDSHLYGTIGVVFSMLTWFIAIAAVFVLGALVGDVLQMRLGGRPADRVQGESPPKLLLPVEKVPRARP